MSVSISCLSRFHVCLDIMSVSISCLSASQSQNTVTYSLTSIHTCTYALKKTINALTPTYFWQDESPSSPPLAAQTTYTNTHTHIHTYIHAHSQHSVTRTRPVSASNPSASRLQSGGQIPLTRPSTASQNTGQTFTQLSGQSTRTRPASACHTIMSQSSQSQSRSSTADVGLRTRPSSASVQNAHSAPMAADQMFVQRAGALIVYVCICVFVCLRVSM